MSTTSGAGLPGGLGAAHAQVLADLARADVKATTLLGFVATAFAGVLALAGRPLPTAAQVVLTVAVAPIVAAVYVLLGALRSRLTNPVPGSWVDTARRGPQSLLDHHHAALHPATPDAAGDLPGRAEIAAATEVHALAVLTHRKHRRINTAVLLLGLAVAGLTTALLLDTLTH